MVARVGVARDEGVDGVGGDVPEEVGTSIGENPLVAG